MSAPRTPARDFVPDEVSRSHASNVATGSFLGSAARLGQIVSAATWWRHAKPGDPCPECRHMRSDHDGRACAWAVNDPDDEGPDRLCGCAGPQPRPFDIGIVEEVSELAADAEARTVVLGGREVIRYRRLALPPPIIRVPDCPLCHEGLDTDGDAWWCSGGCGSWAMGAERSLEAGEVDESRPQCTAIYAEPVGPAGSRPERYRCVLDDGHEPRKSRDGTVLFDHVGVEVTDEGTARETPDDWTHDGVSTKRWHASGRLAW